MLSKLLVITLYLYIFNLTYVSLGTFVKSLHFSFSLLVLLSNNRYPLDPSEYLLHTLLVHD